MMNEDAGRTTELSGARWVKRCLRGAGGFLLFLVGAAIVFAQFGRLAMHAYRIPSSTMEPTLHCARPWQTCQASEADRVLVPRWHPFWTPGRGDIVVFHTPPATVEKCGEGATFVKRVIGLPGETVSERRGLVYVNGKLLSESYVGHRGTQSGSWRVARGGYFVLGDNRPESCDSREWGSVPGKNVIGPAVAIFWPLGRIGSL
jgi:signal peptidase I